ncbi:MAG: DUF1453 domain-containing protein [Oscillospiraceae bacterium]|jgi:hypothetical protein|nr:DUF1453 domain-containing protein [Oscillospiraceae bacterium]
MLDFLLAIIKGTPIYVWVIFAFLVSRGLSLRKDGPVSVKKSMLMPMVFIVWGLWKVITDFAFPLWALVAYIILTTIGTGFGYLLYSSTQKFDVRRSVFFRLGSTVPLVVIMLNFIVKYVLNVCMAINPQLLGDLGFNIIYCSASGLTVGLFIGGICNIVSNWKQMRQKDEGFVL